jgi:hypothetical protein
MIRTLQHGIASSDERRRAGKIAIGHCFATILNDRCSGEKRALPPLGRIIALSGSGSQRKATVAFHGGPIKFILSQSPLRPVRK